MLTQPPCMQGPSDAVARVGRHSVPRVVWGESRALPGACHDSILLLQIVFIAEMLQIELVFS